MIQRAGLFDRHMRGEQFGEARPRLADRIGADDVAEMGCAGGQVVAETLSGFRVLETSHPPTYYLPPGDVAAGILGPAKPAGVCEWKGRAVLHDVNGPGRRAPGAAWSYPNPTPDFAAIAGYVAFYAGPMDACFFDEARVEPQPGGFYGGWITPGIVGPFKGGPGSMGW